MERPSSLSNLWIILRTLAWVLALEGVAEYFSTMHYESLFRLVLSYIIGYDPAVPRLPDSWEEWYYS